MIEKIADADSVFRGDRENLANAQAAVLGGLFFHAFGVDLVDRQQQGLAAAQEQAGKVIVGCGQRSAPIDHHHDGLGLIERDPRLAKDLRRNQLRVVGQDAAGIDHPRMLAGPLDLAVDPVAGDARLIAHDRTARTGETVEESGFAHIGAADDGHDRPRRSVNRRFAPDGGGAAPAPADRAARPRCGASAPCALHRPFADLAQARGCAGFGGRFRSRSSLDLGARVLAAGGRRGPAGGFRHCGALSSHGVRLGLSRLGSFNRFHEYALFQSFIQRPTV